MTGPRPYYPGITLLPFGVPPTSAGVAGPSERGQHGASYTKDASLSPLSTSYLANISPIDW